MNGNDPKYLSLRRKLDEFGYTQTLHPDSIGLVERLFKDQMEVLDEIDKLKSAPKSGSGRPQTTTLVLDMQIEKLEAEKKALERQLQEARSSGGAREADERTLRLQANVNDLRVKLEQAVQGFSEQRQQLEAEIEELALGKSQLQAENQRLRGLGGSLGKLEEENRELLSLIDRKNREIKQLEEASSKARIRTQVLEKTVEELKNAPRDAPDSRNESRITAVLKQELAEAEARCRQARSEAEEAQDELDGLRRELRRAREEISALRLDESKSRSLDSISKAGLEKFEVRLEEARAQVAAGQEEARQLREQVADGEAVQERLNAKIRELAGRVKSLSEQNSDQQAEIELLSGKLTAHLKRVRELEHLSASCEKQLKEALERGSAAGAEEAVGRLEEERARAEGLRREAVVRERELKLLEEEVRIQREQAEQRTVERDKAQLQAKRLLAIIAEGGKNLQVLQLQKEELMKENRELKTGKQQIASSDQASKSELFLLREKCQAFEVEAEELRGAVRGAQAAAGQLEGEVVRLQRQLELSEEKNQEVFQDNREMVMQLKALEQRKNDLHEKVRELQERDQLKNDSSTVARKEFDRLLAENTQLKADLARKDQSLRLIDGERDQLQAELDQETEERDRLQRELAAVREEARRAGKEVDQREYGLNDLKARLSRTESERDDLDRQLHRQCEEALELKDRLNAAEVGCRELQGEVNNLAISNKENEREVERGRLRAAELDRKLRERVKDFEEERERATALGILNGELHADMERERAEVVRLEGLLRELEEANNSMYHHLQQKDQELDHYSHEVEEMQRLEGQLRLEVESYQRQLENLSQDYEFTRGELRQISGDREALRAERNWKKDLAGQSEDWRARQEQRYLQLQQEFDRKRHEVEQLREEVRKLEGLLVEERARSFRLSRQEGEESGPRRTGVGQAALVESRVESYHSENENSSNLHSRSRSESESNVSASMENIRRISEQFFLTTKPNIRS